jgi:hypothetical protein
MMDSAKRAAKVWLAMTMVLLFASLPVFCQQENTQTPPPKEEQPKAAGSATPIAVPPLGDIPDDQGPTNPGPVDPFEGQIKQVGTGLPLLGTSTTPLRWYDFSVFSFEYIGIHDSFDPTGQPSGPWTNINIFRMGLMFDHYIKKNRIVLQYLPQMAIFQGQLHANAGANNSVSFGMSFDLTPRMNLTLQNIFTQVHSNELIPERYLAADAFAGAAVQNNFLDTNGSFIADTASATLQYRFSPRTSLSVSPLFRYAEATSNQVNYVANGNTYQAVATLSHALTPRRNVGLMESYQLVEETAGTVPTSARFNTTGGFYSEQLARALWVTAHAGAEHQAYSDLPGAAHWGLSAGATMVDAVSPTLGLTIAYTRGITFDNYLTTRRSDRVDAMIGLHMFSRFVFNNGGGYFRELGDDPRTSGKYLSTSVDYKLSPNFTAYSTFSYSFQNSNTPQLLSGLRRTISWGLRWQPPVNLPR